MKRCRIGILRSTNDDIACNGSHSVDCWPRCECDSCMPQRHCYFAPPPGSVRSIVMICCVTFASQRVSLIVIPFCLSVWMSVGHSATYSLPRLIDHNHIWSAGIYTCPRTRVSLFGSPVSHTLGARGKICKISPISNAYSCHCERDASCHMTCLFVCLSTRITGKPHGRTSSNFCACRPGGAAM